VRTDPLHVVAKSAQEIAVRNADHGHAMARRSLNRHVGCHPANEVADAVIAVYQSNRRRTIVDAWPAGALEQACRQALA
jgi:hypothetical protein